MRNFYFNSGVFMGRDVGSLFDMKEEKVVDFISWFGYNQI